MPISAILFGGRRRSTVPLVTEAYNWQHGVFLGSIMGSETTAAAAGAVGNLRRDPFAMLPFCGYNMGDYFAHWLSIGQATSDDKLPKLFYVNWFRKGADGKFLWPGYGENSRVLAWVFDRCDNDAAARDTAIGRLPTADALPTDGLQLAPGALDELLSVDEDEWRAELPLIEEHYAVFGDRLPTALARRARRPRQAPGRVAPTWACSVGSSSASWPARSRAQVTGGGWNLGCLGTIVVGIVGGLIGGIALQRGGRRGHRRLRPALDVRRVRRRGGAARARRPRDRTRLALAPRLDLGGGDAEVGLGAGAHVGGAAVGVEIEDDPLTLAQHPEQRPVQRVEREHQLGAVGVEHHDPLVGRGIEHLDRALHD